jgi:hypothetical protein
LTKGSPEDADEWNEPVKQAVISLITHKLGERPVSNRRIKRAAEAIGQCCGDRSPDHTSSSNDEHPSKNDLLKLKRRQLSQRALSAGITQKQLELAERKEHQKHEMFGDITCSTQEKDEFTLNILVPLYIKTRIDPLDKYPVSDGGRVWRPVSDFHLIGKLRAAQLEHACPDGLQMQCPELQCLRLAQFFRELTSDQVIRFFGDNDNIEDFLQTVDKWLEEESDYQLCVKWSQATTEFSPLPDVETWKLQSSPSVVDQNRSDWEALRRKKIFELSNDDTEMVDKRLSHQEDWLKLLHKKADITGQTFCNTAHESEPRTSEEELLFHWLNAALVERLEVWEVPGFVGVINPLFSIEEAVGREFVEGRFKEGQIDVAAKSEDVEETRSPMHPHIGLAYAKAKIWALRVQQQKEPHRNFSDTINFLKRISFQRRKNLTEIAESLSSDIGDQNELNEPLLSAIRLGDGANGTPNEIQALDNLTLQLLRDKINAHVNLKPRTFVSYAGHGVFHNILNGTELTQLKELLKIHNNEQSGIGDEIVGLDGESWGMVTGHQQNEVGDEEWLKDDGRAITKLTEGLKWRWKEKRMPTDADKDLEERVTLALLHRQFEKGFVERSKEPLLRNDFDCRRRAAFIKCVKNAEEHIAKLRRQLDVVDKELDRASSHALEQQITDAVASMGEQTRLLNEVQIAIWDHCDYERMTPEECAECERLLVANKDHLYRDNIPGSDDKEWRIRESDDSEAETAAETRDRLEMIQVIIDEMSIVRLMGAQMKFQVDAEKNRSEEVFPQQAELENVQIRKMCRMRDLGALSQNDENELARLEGKKQERENELASMNLQSSVEGARVEFEKRKMAIWNPDAYFEFDFFGFENTVWLSDDGVVDLAQIVVDGLDAIEEKTKLNFVDDTDEDLRALLLYVRHTQPEQRLPSRLQLQLQQEQKDGSPSKNLYDAKFNSPSKTSTSSNRLAM